MDIVETAVQLVVAAIIIAVGVVILLKIAGV